MNPNAKLLAAWLAGISVLLALILFLGAGTIAWPAGWVFLALFVGGDIALTLWLLRHNPSLLRERMTGLTNPERKAWDKPIMLLNGILFVAWLALMPLDAVRFHWSHVPVALQLAGLMILLCSFYLFFLTFRENPYLSPGERIQRERGQTVVSTGPYRYVRHPMYAGFYLMVLGTTLFLGSWYGMLPAAMLAATVARRAMLEERMLLEELPGYDTYTAQVKYHLVPFIW